jgi:hypothetical protein
MQRVYNRAMLSSTQKYSFEACYGYLSPLHFDVVYDQQKEDT